MKRWKKVLIVIAIVVVIVVVVSLVAINLSSDTNGDSIQGGVTGLIGYYR